MKIITIRTRIQEIVKQLIDKLVRAGNLNLSTQDENTLKLLQDLDLGSCSTEDVEAIARYKIQWQLPCDECGTWVDWVIQVGEPPDWESATAVLCRTCALRVGEMAKEE